VPTLLPFRRPIAIGAATAAVLLMASPAAAHVEPDITSAPAGSRTTVEFVIEHGCDGSPTIEVAMQLPAGVTQVAGQKLPFPTVQRCQVGELAWIDTESAESENPAPILEVTDAVPGTQPPTTAPPPTTATTTTTTLATTTTLTATTAPEAADDEDDGGSSPVPVVVGGAAAVAVAAGGWMAYKRRQA
jgi:hypothetical protein